MIRASCTVSAVVTPPFPSRARSSTLCRFISRRQRQCFIHHVQEVTLPRDESCDRAVLERLTDPQTEPLLLFSPWHGRFSAVPTLRAQSPRRIFGFRLSFDVEHPHLSPRTAPSWAPRNTGVAPKRLELGDCEACRVSVESGNCPSCKTGGGQKRNRHVAAKPRQIGLFPDSHSYVTSLLPCLRTGKSSLTRIDCEDLQPCPQNEIRDCTTSWHGPVDELHSIENKGDTG